MNSGRLWDIDGLAINYGKFEVDPEARDGDRPYLGMRLGACKV
jgi:hypothetical protein